MRSVAVALSSVLAVLAWSTEAAAQASGKTVGKRNDSYFSTDDSPFDTRERRLTVKPLEWRRPPGDLAGPRGRSPSGESGTGGPPGSADAGRPDPRADATARRSFREEWQGADRPAEEEPAARDGAGAGGSVVPGTGNLSAGNFGTQGVFTQYCENCTRLNREFPQRAVGRLFFTTPLGLASCSAAVISGNSVIATAGHCCYDPFTATWNDRFTFAPAYRDGRAPYKTFLYEQAFVLAEWVQQPSRRSDLCLIKLRSNKSRKPVTFYTGWLGRSWNFAPTQSHHVLGYPMNLGGGEFLQLCTSESVAAPAGCGGVDVLNTGCNMTFGSSGGPWVREYRGASFVNGVVSGFDGPICGTSFEQSFNGPRFTSNNLVPLCDAIQC